jgi:NodT family efflux transporter outer membrane factor (OMF) lipoprotein
MRTLLRPVALALVCLLAGCDLAPHYQSPAHDLPVLPASYKEGGPWQPANPSEGLKRGPWWQMYHDPQLDQLEAQLIAANPDLAAAVASYDAYKDQALQLNANLFPFISANGAADRDRESLQRPLRTSVQPTFYGNDLVGGELHYLIDVWGQVHNSVASGVFQAQAAAADLANAQLSLEASLANAYLTLHELDADVQLLVETVAAYQHYLLIVQLRHGESLSSGLEVSQAHYQLDAATAQESGLRAQRAVFEHMIATLVGKPASAFSLAPTLTDIAIPQVPTGVPSSLLQRRPDIAAAERRVAAENAQIGVAKAAFYPQFNINLIGGFQGEGGLPLFSMPLSFWSVGGTMVAPLFEGGLLRAKLGQTVAQWHEATEKYRSTALLAFQQVEDGLSNVNLLSQQYGQQRNAVQDALRTQKLGLDLYQIGAKNYLEVIVDQENALVAEQNAINVKQSLLHASVDLILALGGGWSTDQLPDKAQVLTLTSMDPKAKLPPAPQP